MRLHSWVATLAFVLALSGPVLAQTDGRFTGAVLDPSGALVPDATVVVENEKTGEERTVTSSAEGRYRGEPEAFGLLHRAMAGNFAPSNSRACRSRRDRIQPRSEVHPAGVTESVTVSAGHRRRYELGALGVNVSEREVNSLPVNGRQMSQLLLQAPGAQNRHRHLAGHPLLRHRQRTGVSNATAFKDAIIDASPGNVNGKTTRRSSCRRALKTSGIPCGIEQLQAEYGTGTGGQISVITKSGATPSTERCSIPAQ